MKNLIAALSFLFLSSSLSNAAEITHHSTDNGNEYIVIQGEISEGDAKNFYTLLRQNRHVETVVLNSNGGLVSEGMILSAIVREEKLDTIILNNNVCFSICAPIFFSGAKKYIQKDAMLGVHPAHDAASTQKSPEANALIAWYFGSLGYDIGLVELWISADTKSLNYITAEINQKLNLGIISID